jgi:hypothetical protein
VSFNIQPSLLRVVPSQSWKVSRRVSKKLLLGDRLELEGRAGEKRCCSAAAARATEDLSLCTKRMRKETRHAIMYAAREVSKGCEVALRSGVGLTSDELDRQPEPGPSDVLSLGPVL